MPVTNTYANRPGGKPLGPTAWFQVQPNSVAHMRLFCFPYAGGGAAIYHPWMKRSPSHIEVVPVLLPGRELRVKEPAFTRFELMIEVLTREIVPYLDKPFAFFGHSMGAILSFELARSLRAERRVEPEHLFISGRRSPRAPRVDPYIHDLPDREFVAEIERMNGTPQEVLEHTELMELLIPMLRGDFAVCYTYSYVPGEPLRCPMTVLGGTRDETTPREQLDAWRAETTGDFHVHLLEGDHFFINQQPDKILSIIQRALPPRPEFR